MRRYRVKVPAVEEPSVNLTPLIDVVFVVLIMFVVVAPLLEIDEVALAGSNPDHPHQSLTMNDSRSLQIHVKADNSIWHEKRLLTPDLLKDVLLREHTKNPQVVPLVFHDRHAHFGTYQMVKNTMEAAGFSQVDIVLNPE